MTKNALINISDLNIRDRNEFISDIANLNNGLAIHSSRMNTRIDQWITQIHLC